MKNDFDAFKKKTLEEQSRASRLVGHHIYSIQLDVVIDDFLSCIKIISLWPVEL